MLLVILGIGLFLLLIIVHELGHYLAARLSGVEVEEFGIGFPPRIVGRSFKPNGTLYSLNWLPLGGFVRLKGEHDADTSPGSYGSAPFSQKALILLAGVAMNLLAAAVILTILSATGMPRLVDNQFAVASDLKVVKSEVLITYVADDSPADKAGIAAGDRLISLGNQQIASAEELAELTESLKGQKVDLSYERDGQLLSRSIVFNQNPEPSGYLGVSTGDLVVERSTWSSPLRGIVLTGQFAWLTLDGLIDTVSQLARGQGAAAAENVAGPVGIVVLLNDVSQAGLNFVLMFIALISVTLAVMNALPIPALDGGRLFVSWLFRLMRRPLTAITEERIHATGMAVLMGLVVLITVVDVRRFF